MPDISGGHRIQSASDMRDLSGWMDSCGLVVHVPMLISLDISESLPFHSQPCCCPHSLLLQCSIISLFRPTRQL